MTIGTRDPTPTRTVARAILAGGVFATLLTTGFAYGAGDAVLAGGERLGDAELAACDITEEGVVATLSVRGEQRGTPSLLRWGEPAAAERRAALLFPDGSRVLTDRAWSPTGLLRIDKDGVRLRRGAGWLSFPRDAVRWAVVDADAAGFRLDAPPEEAGSADADTVWLVAGDRLGGRVESFTGDGLKMAVGRQTIETPIEDVAAIRFAETSPVSDAVCLVGWSDGSLVRATRVTIGDGSARVAYAGAAIESEAEAIAFIQPLGGSLRYLSDLEPVDYRHTPYLDLAWPYARDTTIRGAPLAGGGVRRAKGIAMHSAARLVYRLDGTPQRFRAEVAVGDPPPDSAASGSVVFRVYLLTSEGFKPAYESGVVRSGDPAAPIDLDVSEAAALALVVDYADQGDAGDEALWLDARLESDDE